MFRHLIIWFRFRLEQLRGHPRSTVGRLEHRKRRLCRHRDSDHRMSRHRLQAEGRTRPAPCRTGPLVHDGHRDTRMSAPEGTSSAEARSGSDGPHRVR